MSEEKQIVEKTSKERFFNGRGRHFAIPKSCFVSFKLPKHDWQKLKEWIQRGHKVSVYPVSNGEEVMLFDDTELGKLHAKKNQDL